MTSAEAAAGRTTPARARDAVLFRFAAPDGTVAGKGLRRILPPGPVTTLAERVGRFFSAEDGPPILAGAIPFSRDADDHLVQPQRLLQPEDDLLPPPAERAAGGTWQLRAEPTASRFAETVREALRAMSPGLPEGPATHPDAPGAARPNAGSLRKVVLSRTLLARHDAPIDAAALLSRLGTDPRVTSFLVPLPGGDASTLPAGSSQGAAHRVLLGATPELLIRRSGEAVLSHPLAGSAPRLPDAAADRDAAEALRRSAKDQREHALVREFILDALAPFCRDLGTPDGTTITATSTLWHLGTRITGRLRDPDTTVATLLAALHPTPAVCGVPAAAAGALIPRLEGYNRSFYAGAVGWCDARGDGCWYVSIRCAEVAGHEARLFAGAGIVPGSDPASEVRETAAKFGAMLRALGVPADAVPEEAADAAASPPGTDEEAGDPLIRNR